MKAIEQASKSYSKLGEPILPDHVAIARAMRLALDQARIQQHLDVLRDGGLSERQRFGDIATAAFALLLAREEPHDIEPDRMAEGSHDIGNVDVLHGAGRIDR